MYNNNVIENISRDEAMANKAENKLFIKSLRKQIKRIQEQDKTLDKIINAKETFEEGIAKLEALEAKKTEIIQLIKEQKIVVGSRVEVVYKGESIFAVVNKLYLGKGKISLKSLVFDGNEWHTKAFSFGEIVRLVSTKDIAKF